MTRLSVNINKIATLRNARGNNTPNVVQAALNCEKFGAEGITVHPRPDERHIAYQDIRDLKSKVQTEFNIEGYPNDTFMNLVLENQPHQVTLVPDAPDVLTSNAGWDTIKDADLLSDVISTFKKANIRVSLFMECNSYLIEKASHLGADRVELYTEAYANGYLKNKTKSIKPYIMAAEVANKNGLGLNAGHDLSLENLEFFNSHIPNLMEVSIGHALISDSLYYGLENTIQMYKRKLQKVSI